VSSSHPRALFENGTLPFFPSSETAVKHQQFVQLLPIWAYYLKLCAMSDRSSVGQSPPERGGMCTPKATDYVCYFFCIGYLFPQLHSVHHSLTG